MLQVKNLSVDFITDNEITTAVSNLNFNVHAGEITAIVGESGSGKSVTALSILQILPSPPAKYTSGEILFTKNNVEIDLLKMDGKQMRAVRGKDIAMIFQEPMTSLNPVHTCGSQVMEVIMLHQKLSNSAAKEKTIELFRKVKLPDPENIINRFPHQLSGGQKQRVMIAMAISCNPALLIADEPTTALDVTVQKTILQLLKELQQKSGMGVMYITHDLNLVAEIADKVVVMYKGSIVEAGPAAQIFSFPAHPYTKALIACRPSAQPKGIRLPVVSDFMHLDNNAEIKIFNVPTSDINAQTELAEQTMLTDNVIVQVRNLVVKFPAKKNFFGRTIRHHAAVDDVSFDIFRGETLGLVGESGCGKTTLGRAMIQLVTPDSGSIVFEGTDIAKISSSNMRLMRKNIQIIFQDPYGSLNPRMNIGSAILEPMKVHDVLLNNRQRKDKVLELLEKVNLKPEHFNRYPHEFSGGQRQRICIARALALNPSFIICDESVSALDVSVQAQVLNLLNDLKKEYGFTCIFISHDLGVVRYISDRIMVMNKGKIIETGPAEQVYFSPKEDYTKKLIAAIPGKNKNDKF